MPSGNHPDGIFKNEKSIVTFYNSFAFSRSQSLMPN